MIEDAGSIETQPGSEPVSGDGIEEAVRLRAYVISTSAHSRSPDENWRQAEREIRAGAADDGG